MFYHLPDATESANVSAQASYHTADLDGRGPSGPWTNRRRVEMRTGFGPWSFTVLYAGILASAKEPVTESGALPFGTLGYAKLDGTSKTDLGSDDADRSGLAFSVGFVMPIGPGQVYGNYQSFDGEGSLGGGFRYAFK